MSKKENKMNIFDRILQFTLIFGFLATLIILSLSTKDINFWVYLGLIIGILAGVFYKKLANGFKWLIKHFKIKIKTDKVDIEEDESDDMKDCQ